MKKYPSPTANGGQTIILPSMQEAIALGRKQLEKTLEHLRAFPPDRPLKLNLSARDEPGATRTKNTTYGALVKRYEAALEKYGECEKAIVHGDDKLKEDIARMAEQLHDLALDLAPSLRSGFSGFDRAEDGVTAAPELLAAGEERPCFRRKEGADNVRSGSGDGAYRIIINTDVASAGTPVDNAAMLGAFVVLLQQFKPVEVWIQQGWLSHPPHVHPGDGVTLFKLDFTGAFDPTALAFWVGHELKDHVFSYQVNMALGRQHMMTSKIAEIDCDLYLRGDQMLFAGINQTQFVSMLHTDKLDLMAKWVADTACKVVFAQTEPPPITL